MTAPNASPASKTCIVIAGPTAVGKTELAIDIARHFNTEIISADSRQCFRELNIGVARPSPEELQQVPHHFIASHSIQDTVTAATFEQYALEKANTIFGEHDQLVVAGGTGLYIKAFCEGMDPMPSIDPAIRNAIREQYEQQGMTWLQATVAQEDAGYYATGEIQNPQRLMRALEVIRATGQSLRSFQQGTAQQRPFNIIKIGLELPRELLYDRINQRVDMMIKAGLEAEVRGLLPFRTLNALQTVGYSEMISYLDGAVSLPKAIELIQRNTRHYAKRQLTWFKKDTAFRWFAPDQTEAIITHIRSRL